jgi:uncharacterized protein (DUF1499 family)
MKQNLSATLAAAAAAVAVLSVVLAPLLARLGILTPYTAFRVFALGAFAGGLGAAGFGFFSLLRTWSATEVPGRGLAWTGALVGAGIFLALALAGAKAGKVPPIHDVTTAPGDPPAFTEALKHPDNRGRDLTYPHGAPGTRERQETAYPDLAPISFAAPPEEALAAARRAAEQLGWEVTWESPGQGLLEATETSGLFRFVDDVVVRVRPGADGGSVVDLRSTSRVGISDLGANAARIRAFRDALAAGS